MRKLLLLVGLAAPLLAQMDRSELLSRVREKVLRTVDQIPRYLCIQTIDRLQFAPEQFIYAHDCEELERSRHTGWKLLPTTADRLRLEVAIAHKREVYSWTGESQFKDRNLSDVVNDGVVSTGYFQGFLNLVFRSDSASFSYAGDVTDQGRRLAQFRYRVPLGGSHYEFRSETSAVTTAYEGTVLADPETADLVRLTVRTSQLSTKTGSCEAATTMNYGRFRLSGSGFLLPSDTLLHIKDLNGSEMENRTVYSGCREFLGESTVKFDASPDEPSEKAAAKQVQEPLPAGLRFGLALAKDIHVATAAAGDMVRAALTTDLADGSKRLAPKGTPLVCRILRVRRYYHSRDPGPLGKLVPLQRVDLLLRLESLMTAGGPRAIFADREMATEEAPRRRSKKIQIRPVEAGQNLWLTSFEPAGDDYVIQSGLHSDWVTAKIEL
ncbi:MAG: hypothetical protein M1436_03195 [Acidobacteria bacterium]|nr:hypothetical protein [Acidobacteriota bacterium]